MKKFRVIESFKTAVITEIEMPDDFDLDIGGDLLIDAHIEEVSEWSYKAYGQEIARNADDSEFEIEEITE